MFEKISYIPFFGIPLLYWFGLIGLLCILSAALIDYLINSKKAQINFNWHKRFAIIGVIFVIIHAFFAITAIFF
jgi:cytochrome b561